MAWRVVLAKTAGKQFRRLPLSDRARVSAAIERLAIHPFSGDVVKLAGKENVWRQRVGSYRVIFEPVASREIIYIYDIAPRTTNTYG